MRRREGSARIDSRKVYSTGDAGAINVKSNPRKARALSAYIQYCTENSPAIRCGRDKTIDDLVGTGGDRWHGFMRYGHFLAGSEYVSQQYEICRPFKRKRPDDAMERWYTLPKVGRNSDT